MLDDLKLTEDDIAKWPGEEAVFLRGLRQGASTRSLKAEYVESLQGVEAARCVSAMGYCPLQLIELLI
jgi:hypothetical protein